MPDITFKLTAATTVGIVRSNNEDNFIVNPDLSESRWKIPDDTESLIPLSGAGCLMVVADGMGGMNAGEVASELAVSGIQHSFDSVEDLSLITDTPGHIESFMKKVIVSADSDIKRRVKEDPATEGMGTTVVMAWILGNIVHVAWCGDSRAYLFNRQSGLSRLSRDHSYVQQLVDSGKLDPELAFDHPNSNIITRSLGDSNTTAQPDYMSKGLSKGDMILLCSDGICGLIRDEDIAEILSRDYETINEYRDALIDAAMEAGGHDNATIALLDCELVKENDMEKTLSATIKPATKAPRKIWRLLLAIAVLAGLLALAVHLGWIPLAH